MASQGGIGGGSLEVELVSHASVLIRTGGGAVWTDPWLRSAAFNDSWRLLGDPTLDVEADLDDVRWIWISHEHPDHFNVPTLRSLPDSFKERVIVLFQATNSDKVRQALERFGFPNHRSLPHRKLVALTADVSVYCHQVGQMDSVLYVRDASGSSVLDVNDAELGSQDCRRIVADVGSPDVVLNQFSVAGYDGLPDPDRRIREQGRRILANVADNQRDLGAPVTIPIASFVYFCAPDNAYVNPHVTTPAAVAAHLDDAGLGVKVLDLGERWAVGAPIENHAAIAAWDDRYARIGDLPVTAVTPVPLEEIRTAFERRCDLLHQRFPRVLLRRTGPVTVRVTDLDTTVEVSIADRRLVEVDRPHDVAVASQPLHLVFDQPFGLQTLGVSARYALTGPSAPWKWLRVVMALDNAELYLTPRHLLDGRAIRHLAARSRGAVGQLAYQVRRM